MDEITCRYTISDPEWMLSDWQHTLNIVGIVTQMALSAY